MWLVWLSMIGIVKLLAVTVYCQTSAYQFHKFSVSMYFIKPVTYNYQKAGEEKRKDFTTHHLESKQEALWILRLRLRY